MSEIENLLARAQAINDNFKDDPPSPLLNFIRELVPSLEIIENDSKILAQSRGGRSLSSGGSEEDEAEDALLTHVPFIRKLDLFKDLNYQDLASIVKTMKIHHYSAGDYVIKKGEMGESLFILLSGKVDVVVELQDGTSKKVHSMGPRDIVGEISLLTGQPRTANVVAAETTTCFELHKNDFNNLCRVHPPISGLLTKMLADRLGSDSGSMLDKQIGEKYQIAKKVGEGGMGIVYLAQDTKLGRMVAMKMLPHRLVFNENFVKQFLSEGKMVARLDHENIVRLYDVVDAYATYFMVMEFIDGPSLEDLLEQEKVLKPTRVVDVLKQIIPAMEYARTLGIVHRDLKPDNIKLTSDGKIKIMDFGIAVTERADESGAESEYEGKTAGTIRYMSPEQGQGREVDYRSDIYSLGVVLYQMLTGKTPFMGNTLISIVMQQLTKPTPRPSQLNKEVPPWLDDLVHYMLERDPDKRLSSYDGTLNILKHLQMGTLPWDVRLPFKDGDFIVDKNQSFVSRPSRGGIKLGGARQVFFTKEHTVACSLLIGISSLLTLALLRLSFFIGY